MSAFLAVILVCEDRYGMCEVMSLSFVARGESISGGFFRLTYKASLDYLRMYYVDFFWMSVCVHLYEGDISLGKEAKR